MYQVQELIARANRLQRETELAASRDLVLHAPPPGYDAAGKSMQGYEASSTSHGREKNKQPQAHHERSASSQPRDHGRDPAGRHDDSDDNDPRAGRNIKERVGAKVTVDQRLGALGPAVGNDARQHIKSLKA